MMTTPIQRMKKNILKQLTTGPVGRAVPSTLRETAFLRTFGLTKIPMLFFCAPTVLELNDRRCVIKIPLRRRTRNHLNSMYFGALAVGADCAGGIIAMRAITQAGADVSLVFKDFKADFLKRPEADVHFTCEEGAEILAMVHQAIASGERENIPVHITATAPAKTGDEPVAKFVLTLSLKRRGAG